MILLCALFKVFFLVAILLIVLVLFSLVFLKERSEDTKLTLNDEKKYEIEEENDE